MADVAERIINADMKQIMAHESLPFDLFELRVEDGSPGFILQLRDKPRRQGRGGVNLYSYKQVKLQRQSYGKMTARRDYGPSYRYEPYKVKSFFACSREEAVQQADKLICMDANREVEHLQITCAIRSHDYVADEEAFCEEASAFLDDAVRGHLDMPTADVQVALVDPDDYDKMDEDMMSRDYETECAWDAAEAALQELQEKEKELAALRLKLQVARAGAAGAAGAAAATGPEPQAEAGEATAQQQELTVAVQGSSREPVLPQHGDSGSDGSTALGPPAKRIKLEPGTEAGSEELGQAVPGQLQQQQGTIEALGHEQQQQQDAEEEQQQQQQRQDSNLDAGQPIKQEPGTLPSPYGPDASYALVAQQPFSRAELHQLAERLLLPRHGTKAVSTVTSRGTLRTAEQAIMVKPPIAATAPQAAQQLLRAYQQVCQQEERQQQQEEEAGAAGNRCSSTGSSSQQAQPPRSSVELLCQLRCFQVWLQHYALQGEELLPAAFRGSGQQQGGSSGLGSGQQAAPEGGGAGGAGDVVSGQVVVDLSAQPEAIDVERWQAVAGGGAGGAGAQRGQRGGAGQQRAVKQEHGS